MVLKTFSYLSRLLVDLQDDELRRIQVSSEEYNRQHGVTGLLLFDGAYFAQIIEGTEEGLIHIRARIMRDARHELVRVGPEVAIASRQFSDWSLRVVNTRPEPVAGTIEQQLRHDLGVRVHPELISFFGLPADDGVG